MSNDPYLDFVLTERSQKDKHITLNEADAQISAAFNAFTSITVTGNFTLTAAQIHDNTFIILGGTPAADYTVQMPAGIGARGNLAFFNNSGKIATLENDSSDAANPIDLIPGDICTAHYNGVEPQPNWRLTSFTPAALVQSLAGHAGEALKVNSTEDGFELGAVAGAGGGSISTYPPFRGCIATLSADKSGLDFTTEGDVAWDANDKDTDGFHSTTVNNARISIPAGSGIKMVEVGYSLQFTNTNTDQFLRARIAMNGNFLKQQGGQICDAGIGFPRISGISGPIPVTPGTTYFTVSLQDEADTSFGFAKDQSCFWIKVIETDDSGQSLGNQLLVGGDFNTSPWARGTTFDSTTTPANNDGNYLADNCVLLSDGNDVVDVTQDSDGSLLATVQTANKQFGFLIPVAAKDAAHAIGNIVSAGVKAKGSGLATLRIALLAWSGTADSITLDVVSAWAGGGTEPTWATNWTREGEITDLSLSASYGTGKINAAPIDTASAKQFALFAWIDDTDGAGADTLNIAWMSAIFGAFHPDILPKRILADEQAACRWFYEVISGGAGEHVTDGFADSADDCYGVVPFEEKRVAPTVTLSVASTWAVRDAGADVTSLASVNADQIRTNRLRLNANKTSGFTAGHGVSFKGAAASTAKIELDASL